MKVDFRRLTWENYPSTETPINADNLNRLEEGVAGLYSDVAEIEQELGGGVGEYVTDWLNEHVDPVGSAVVVDDTLTIEGAAADAKKTGDEITSLKEEINYILEPITNTSLNSGGYINGDKNGKLVASSSPSFDNYHYTDYFYCFDCKKIEAFSLLGTHAGIAFYDADKAYISGQVDAESTAPKLYTLTVPTNAYYVRFSYDGTGGVYTDTSVFYAKLYFNLRKPFESIRQNINKVCDDFVLIPIGTEVTNAFINGSNGVETAITETKCSDFINIDGLGGQTLVITSCLNEAGGYAFYDANKRFILGNNGTSYGTSSATLQKVIDTIPQKAVYIRITTYWNSATVGNASILLKGINIANLAERMTKVERIQHLASLWMFSDIAVCGDSYSAGAIYTDNDTFYGEVPQISWGKALERMGSANVSLYASSGANTNLFLSRSNCLPKILSDAEHELYVIALGINDYSSITLGSMADINVDYTLNPNTYYGNMGRIIAQIQNHAPNSKIIIMKSLIPKSANGAYYRYNSLAVEEIASYFNIAYGETYNDDFLMSDFYMNGMVGAHPTAPTYAALALSLKNIMEETIETQLSHFIDFNPDLIRPF